MRNIAPAILALIAVFAWGLFTGDLRGAARVRADLVAEALVQSENLRAAELARAELQTERDRLAQSLEDLANADPVVHPVCLPVGRVLRLNAQTR